MGTRKDKVLLNILLGTGVYLLDSWRNRMGGTVDELRSRAQDTYETAADRVSLPPVGKRRAATSPARLATFAIVSPLAKARPPATERRIGRRTSALE
jgi:hypothetical protein